MATVTVVNTNYSQKTNVIRDSVVGTPLLAYTAPTASNFLFAVATLKSSYQSPASASTYDVKVLSPVVGNPNDSSDVIVSYASVSLQATTANQGAQLDALDNTANSRLLSDTTGVSNLIVNSTNTHSYGGMKLLTGEKLYVNRTSGSGIGTFSFEIIEFYGAV